MKACALSRSNTESMGTCPHLQLLFWKLYLALNIYVEASVQMGCSPKIHIHKPLHDKINKMALAKQIITSAWPYLCLRPELFLLVDLQKKNSDLGSGGRKKVPVNKKALKMTS